MHKEFEHRKFSLPFRGLVWLVITAFCSTLITPPTASAQSTFISSLPQPGVMVPVSTAYDPAMIMGIKLYPDNPIKFDFIVHKGDSGLEGDELEIEVQNLISYFLASLTIPEKDMWVNLSPYEKDKIIERNFGLTKMGRDLLAQDYVLKQLTASVIYPEDDLGKEFWQTVYDKARKLYGTSDIPINTFNKVWIVPDEALVYENSEMNATFVAESTLKVLLESDYVALKNNDNNEELGTNQLMDDELQDVNEFTSNIVREIVIPAIEKEVNYGKNFARLRQIYHSLILATWYKEKLRQSVLAQFYFDQGKVVGVDVDDKEINKKIYGKYLEAYRQGVYNFIKDEYDPMTQQIIPRKYFSGGMQLEFNVTPGSIDLRDALGRRPLRRVLQAGPPDYAGSPVIAVLASAEASQGETGKRFKTALAQQPLERLKRLLQLANDQTNPDLAQRAESYKAYVAELRSMLAGSGLRMEAIDNVDFDDVSRQSAFRQLFFVAANDAGNAALQDAQELRIEDQSGLIYQLILATIEDIVDEARESIEYGQDANRDITNALIEVFIHQAAINLDGLADLIEQANNVQGVTEEDFIATVMEIYNKVLSEATTSQRLGTPNPRRIALYQSQQAIEGGQQPVSRIYTRQDVAQILGLVQEFLQTELGVSFGDQAEAEDQAAEAAVEPTGDVVTEETGADVIPLPVEPNAERPDRSDQVDSGTLKWASRYEGQDIEFPPALLRNIGEKKGAKKVTVMGRDGQPVEVTVVARRALQKYPINAMRTIDSDANLVVGIPYLIESYGEDLGVPELQGANNPELLGYIQNELFEFEIRRELIGVELGMLDQLLGKKATIEDISEERMKAINRTAHIMAFVEQMRFEAAANSSATIAATAGVPAENVDASIELFEANVSELLADLILRNRRDIGRIGQTDRENAVQTLTALYNEDRGEVWRIVQQYGSPQDLMNLFVVEMQFHIDLRKKMEELQIPIPQPVDGLRTQDFLNVRNTIINLISENTDFQAVLSELLETITTSGQEVNAATIVSLIGGIDQNLLPTSLITALNADIENGEIVFPDDAEDLNARVNDLLAQSAALRAQLLLTQQQTKTASEAFEQALTELETARARDRNARDDTATEARRNLQRKRINFRNAKQALAAASQRNQQALGQLKFVSEAIPVVQDLVNGTSEADQNEIANEARALGAQFETDRDNQQEGLNQEMEAYGDATQALIDGAGLEVSNDELRRLFQNYVEARRNASSATLVAEIYAEFDRQLAEQVSALDQLMPQLLQTRRDLQQALLRPTGQFQFQFLQDQYNRLVSEFVALRDRIEGLRAARQSRLDALEESVADGPDSRLAAAEIDIDFLRQFLNIQIGDERLAYALLAADFGNGKAPILPQIFAAMQGQEALLGQFIILVFNQQLSNQVSVDGGIFARNVAAGISTIAVLGALLSNGSGGFSGNLPEVDGITSADIGARLNGNARNRIAQLATFLTDGRLGLPRAMQLFTQALEGVNNEQTRREVFGLMGQAIRSRAINYQPGTVNYQNILEVAEHFTSIAEQDDYVEVITLPTYANFALFGLDFLQMERLGIVAQDVLDEINASIVYETTITPSMSRMIIRDNGQEYIDRLARLDTEVEVELVNENRQQTTDALNLARSAVRLAQLRRSNLARETTDQIALQWSNDQVSAAYDYVLAIGQFLETQAVELLDTDILERDGTDAQLGFEMRKIGELQRLLTEAIPLLNAIDSIRQAILNDQLSLDQKTTIIQENQLIIGEQLPKLQKTEWFLIRGQVVTDFISGRFTLPDVSRILELGADGEFVPQEGVPSTNIFDEKSYLEDDFAEVAESVQEIAALMDETNLDGPARYAVFQGAGQWNQGQIDDSQSIANLALQIINNLSFELGFLQGNLDQRLTESDTAALQLENGQLREGVAQLKELLTIILKLQRTIVQSNNGIANQDEKAQGSADGMMRVYYEDYILFMDRQSDEFKTRYALPDRIIERISPQPVTFGRGFLNVFAKGRTFVLGTVLGAVFGGAVGLGIQDINDNGLLKDPADDPAEAGQQLSPAEQANLAAEKRRLGLAGLLNPADPNGVVVVEQELSQADLADQAAERRRALSAALSAGQPGDGTINLDDLERRARLGLDEANVAASLLGVTQDAGAAVEELKSLAEQGIDADQRPLEAELAQIDADARARAAATQADLDRQAELQAALVAHNQLAATLNYAASSQSIEDARAETLAQRNLALAAGAQKLAELRDVMTLAGFGDQVPDATNLAQTIPVNLSAIFSQFPALADLVPDQTSLDQADQPQATAFTQEALAAQVALLRQQLEAARESTTVADVVQDVGPTLTQLEAAVEQAPTPADRQQAEALSEAGQAAALALALEVSNAAREAELAEQAAAAPQPATPEPVSVESAIPEFALNAWNALKERVAADNERAQQALQTVEQGETVLSVQPAAGMTFSQWSFIYTGEASNADFEAEFRRLNNFDGDLGTIRADSNYELPGVVVKWNVQSGNNLVDMSRAMTGQGNQLARLLEINNITAEEGRFIYPGQEYYMALTHEEFAAFMERNDGQMPENVSLVVDETVGGLKISQVQIGDEVITASMGAGVLNTLLTLSLAGGLLAGALTSNGGSPFAPRSPNARSGVGGSNRSEDADDAAAEQEQKLGGIDLEAVSVQIQSDGIGVTTAFDDPVQLERLKNAPGLTPVIYGIEPMPLPMINLLLGANDNDNIPLDEQDEPTDPQYLEAAYLRKLPSQI